MGAIVEIHFTGGTQSGVQLREWGAVEELIRADRRMDWEPWEMNNIQELNNLWGQESQGRRFSI